MVRVVLKIIDSKINETVYLSVFFTLKKYNTMAAMLLIVPKLRLR